jgi:hypothetical protein
MVFNVLPVHVSRARITYEIWILVPLTKNKTLVDLTEQAIHKLLNSEKKESNLQINQETTLIYENKSTKK